MLAMQREGDCTIDIMGVFVRVSCSKDTNRLTDRYKHTEPTTQAASHTNTSNQPASWGATDTLSIESVRAASTTKGCKYL